MYCGNSDTISAAAWMQKYVAKTRGEDEQWAVFRPTPTSCPPKWLARPYHHETNRKCSSPPPRLQSLDWCCSAAATQQTQSLNTRDKYLKDPQVRPLALRLRQQAVFLRTGVFVHKLPPPGIRKPFVEEARAPERSIIGVFFAFRKPGNTSWNSLTWF